ncbi:MAG: hypothetical protein K9J37_19800 [Saprospiraceae bacterium]|nr:hypothetical protein [Saprospiraceae bacterium]MCF8252171.1 hypothetical protein [Saprospiraceae bacterium]MCF8281576.1 hypothetical protein [Bacteroidales bacterium]MCF8313840.1 hypothetical protein [Saprospiraceae bacterium]MCF8442568.1 hypothetical protein [Saprospiraceae bacterium]
METMIFGRVEGWQRSGVFLLLRKIRLQNPVLEVPCGTIRFKEVAFYREDMEKRAERTYWLGGGRFLGKKFDL